MTGACLRPPPAPAWSLRPSRGAGPPPANPAASPPALSPGRASLPTAAAGVCPAPDRRRGAHLGLAAADGPRPDGARLLVPAENFGDAAVGHSQLARDDTGPYAMVGHLHYLVSDMVG